MGKRILDILLPGCVPSYDGVVYGSHDREDRSGLGCFFRKNKYGILVVSYFWILKTRVWKEDLHAFRDAAGRLVHALLDAPEFPTRKKIVKMTIFPKKKKHFKPRQFHRIFPRRPPRPRRGPRSVGRAGQKDGTAKNIRFPQNKKYFNVINTFSP